MNQDRGLLVIVGVIGVLIALSITLFFVRGTEPEFRTEDTPEGILHNFVLSLHFEDYERAYNYLSDQDGKPNYVEFKQNFIGSSFDINNTGLQIGSSDIDDGEAIIQATVIHRDSDPFAGSWDETGSAWLIMENGGWKITYLPYPYWGWEWYSKNTPEG